MLFRMKVYPYFTIPNLTQGHTHLKPCCINSLQTNSGFSYPSVRMKVESLVLAGIISLAGHRKCGPKKKPMCLRNFNFWKMLNSVKRLKIRRLR